MKKDVILIANYWHFEEEKSSSRYRTFANILCEHYDLEVITSTFCHLTKAQRKVDGLNLDKLPYKMTLQYEQGYRKNISVQRIISYTQFGKNVLSYLKKRKRPDLIVLSIPSLAVADYVSSFAKKNNIPLIIDIQDLWPEAFKMALNVPVISDILFAPMMWQANRIYRRADVVMAVSNTYVKRGKQVNPLADELCIYIGSDSALISTSIQDVEIHKEGDKFVIGYIGALGHSYDIKGVIDAIKRLKDNGITDIKFKIMGDGVCRKEFEEYAKLADIDFEFTGLLKYGAMMKSLMQCDIAVNPIVGKSVSSIINKVADYAAAGIPVVNTQNSLEYRTLLDEYHAGINVKNGSIEELADAIRVYYCDTDRKKKDGINGKIMYDQLFDRRKNYTRLVKTIDSLLQGEKEV